MAESDVRVEEDFEVVLRVLPRGWQEKAKELGALRRRRHIDSPEVLLRLLLIHLAEGCSLRETAAIARRSKLAHVSDVALMERLRMSGRWFQWMNQELMASWAMPQPNWVYGNQWNVRLVDGSCIKEPGPTGSSWRIHYSIRLPSLACEELSISSHKGPGESFKRFTVHAGDLFIGDRAYGVAPGIAHVVSQGGEVLARFAMSNLPLSAPEGGSFALLEHLRTLRGARIGDWPAMVSNGGWRMAGRVCAVRKSRQAAENARKQVFRQAHKKGGTIKDETLEAAEYVYVFTTLPEAALSPSNVLEVYRGRWQIELVFKRLKSILGLGHLRKIDPDSAKAWLHGKLFVAFLVETLLRYAESFFPWGYPLSEQDNSLPLA